ncbi:uncharacterized protein LOC111106259 isoform X2 [Crassostrea virginica]
MPSTYTTPYTNSSESNVSTPPPLELWDKILNFVKENLDIWIKVGIGLGGLLFGILLMTIIHTCKKKKEKKQDNSRSANGTVTNGRSPEEMDNIIRQYISDSNTMKNQWKNQEQVPDSAHQPLVYHPDDDVMVEQQTHDMRLYIDPVSNPPNTEYTNSGIIQDYRTDDGHAGNAVSGYGEDYFVESTEHNSHYNSGLHTDAFGNQFDQYGAPVGANHTDNYFLLQKDFVPGMESIGYTDEVTEL